MFGSDAVDTGAGRCGKVHQKVTGNDTLWWSIKVKKSTIFDDFLRLGVDNNMRLC
jgi:hypothetical protein